MKKIFIKIGAYLFLVFGIIISLAFAGAGIYTFVGFPNASLSKKSVIGSGLFLAALIIFLMVFALFESLIESAVLEEEIGELEEKLWESETRHEQENEGQEAKNKPVKDFHQENDSRIDKDNEDAEHNY